MLALFSSMPYVSIISTQIVNYQQLSIIFSCATVISTVGPIVTGSCNNFTPIVFKTLYN